MEQLQKIRSWFSQEPHAFTLDTLTTSDTAPPEHCPGVCFEFEEREGLEEVFLGYIAILGPIFHNLRHLSPHVVASQLVSTYPVLSWVERYKDDSCMELAVGSLTSRDYCANDMHWVRMCAFTDGLSAAGILRRVVTLGEMSDRTRVIVQHAIVRFGGIVPSLRVLPAAHPAWLNMLVHSGEVVAMHSLSANSAADAKNTAGAEISYTVRDFVRGNLSAITPAFTYEVMATFGSADGGRAIVVRPKHSPRSLYVCFRGVRREDAVNANESDRQALLDQTMTSAAWLAQLPGRSGRELTARTGVIAHHESVYSAPACLDTAVASSSFAASDVDVPPHWLGGVLPTTSMLLPQQQPGFFGFATEDASGDDPERAGPPMAKERTSRVDLPCAETLHEWLADYAAGRICAEGDACGSSSSSSSDARTSSASDAGTDADAEESERRLLFVGFSLGGALAQLTALRASLDFPSLAPRMRVLALGAVQWASPDLSTAFAEQFGRRAVHLLTAVPKSSTSGRAEAQELWNIGKSTLVDPMTLGSSEQTSYTHNLILCETSGAADERMTAHSEAAVRAVRMAAVVSASESSDDECFPSPSLLTDVSAFDAAAFGPHRPRLQLEGGGSGNGGGTLALRLPLRPPISAWPLVSAGLISLQRRRPDIWHERAFMGYWLGNIKPSHPFARDVKTLHTGQAYRAALIREHRRLLRFSTFRGNDVDERPAASNRLDRRRKRESKENDGTLLQVGEGSLPLVMQVDGAWDCTAGVINQHLPTLLEHHEKPIPSLAASMSPARKRLSSNDLQGLQSASPKSTSPSSSFDDLAGLLSVADVDEERALSSSMSTPVGFPTMKRLGSASSLGSKESTSSLEDLTMF